MGKKSRQVKNANKEVAPPPPPQTGAEGEDARLRALKVLDAEAAAALAKELDGLADPSSSASAAEDGQAAAAEESPFTAEWESGISEGVEAAKKIYLARAAGESRLALQFKHAREQRERDLKKFAILEESSDRLRHEGALIFNELDKTKALKDKLQQLCRQLQKQNKAVMESAQASNKEMTDKFGSTLDDVAAKLEEQEKVREEQRVENDKLRTQLGDLLGKFDAREAVFENELQHSKLETQLAEARLDQQTALREQEAARGDLLKSELDKAAETAKASAEEMKLYQERFTQLQEAVDKSNGVFKEYGQRLEELTKEREKTMGQNRALHAIVKQSELRDAKVKAAEKVTQKELASTRAQKVKLEKLCRTLQGERAQRIAEIDSLQKKLKGAQQDAEGGGEADTDKENMEETEGTSASVDGDGAAAAATLAAGANDGEVTA